MSFATVADYEAKYGAVDDTAVLQEWLDDATTTLTGWLGDRVETIDADVLRMVCRDMAHRAYDTGMPGIPAKSWTQQANGFMEQVTYANPTGDFYLTKNERSLLGLGGSSVGFVSSSLSPAYGGE